MKNVFYLFIALVVFGCKEDRKAAQKANNVEQAVEAPNVFIVKMSFKTNKEDEFKLMLNNVIIDEFQRKNIHIIEKVTPTSSIDELTANFGENISYDFQLNLGNKIPKEVEIISIDLFYGGNSIHVTPQNINDYFAVNNKYVQYDTLTNKLNTIKVEGKHFPSVVLRKDALNILIGK